MHVPMKARRLVVSALLVCGSVLVGVSCSSILGIEDTRVSGDAGPDLVCEEPAETACSGACVDTTVEAANCGGCGRDCGGGTCTDGKCSALAIATDLEAPYALAVTPSGEQVFWINATDIYRCPTTGCVGRPARIAELAVLSPPVPVQRRNRIVATNNEIFWLGKTSSDALLSCPTAGCGMNLPGLKTGHGLDTPRGLSLIGDKLVVAQRFAATICEQAGGCATVSGAGADSMQSATMDESKVYWAESTDPAGLYSVTRASGAVQRLTQDRGQVVRLLGEDLYVQRTLSEDIYRCARTGCSGVGTQVVTGTGNSTSMVVDDRGIYWTVRGNDTAATGEVRSCPLAGCGGAAPAVLASGLAQPTDLTLQGDFLFWVNHGLPGVAASGSVMRVRR